jgi:hypothetical protein
VKKIKNRPIFSHAKSSRGQGLIEALSLSFTFMAMASVLLTSFYFSAVHAGLSYLLHENLVCEETQGRTDCREEFLRRSRTFLFSARILHFESSKGFNNRVARIEVRMPFKRVLKIQKEMDLYR